MHQCIKFILFWNDTLHVSDGLSFHYQELQTVHTATALYQTDTAVRLGDRGSTVVKALCYKSEGRWFSSRWCHWNFSLA